MNINAEREDDGTLAVAPVKPKLQKPPMYQVVIYNDDYTPMDFVVTVLRDVFQMNEQRSVNVMLQVHQQGRGICGIFSKEVAETKVNLVTTMAEEAGHPLRTEAEPVDNTPKSSFGLK